MISQAHNTLQYVTTIKKQKIQVIYRDFLKISLLGSLPAIFYREVHLSQS